MSTRSVIARKNGTGFTGVYHHWDGYPSGLGATLFELRNKHFKGDTAAMLAFLIDEHPAGWSTINGADFLYPPSTGSNDNIKPCDLCGKPTWAHYRQYWGGANGGNFGKGSTEWKACGKPAQPEGTETLVYGHPAKRPEKDEPHGPVYTRGEASEMNERNASDCGCEYAYVFDGNGTMLIQSSYCDPNGKHSSQKMIGAFGCGDPKATWKTIAVVNLDGTEPDWDKIDKSI